MLVAAGRTWAAAGLGLVVEVTPSQSAPNALAAGEPELQDRPIPVSCGRSGRCTGPVELWPDKLVLMDETSMVSTSDLADEVASDWVCRTIIDDRLPAAEAAS